MKIKYYIPLLIILSLFTLGTSPIINRMLIDSSVFFTMGRGLCSHMLPYRDLFDHKGLYLFFINGLGALISPNSSIGLWLVETLFLGIDILILDRLYSLFFNDNLKVYFCVSIHLMVFLNYFIFNSGNMSETYAFTFQLASIWIATSFFINKENTFPPHLMFIQGILFSFTLMLRVNIALMWGSTAIVILSILFISKNHINLIKNVISGLMGCIIGILPIAIYGIITQTLDDIIYSNYTFNFIYTKNRSSNIFVNLYRFLFNKITIWLIVSLIICVIIVIISKSFITRFKIWFIMMLIFETIGCCLTNYPAGHYYEMVVPFLFPLIVATLKRVNKPIFINNFSLSFLVILIILSNGGLAITILNKSNVIQTESYLEYNYAKEIKEKLEPKYLSTDSSVLVTGNSCVYYNVLNVIPDVKYFYIPDVAYSEFPDAIDCQIKNVQDSHYDILIVRYNDYMTKSIYKDVDNKALNDAINSNYTIFDTNEKLGVNVYINNSDL